MDFPINDPKTLADLFENALHEMHEEDTLGPTGNRILDYVEEHSRGCRSWNEFIANIESAIDRESEKLKATGLHRVEQVTEDLRREYVHLVRPLYALVVMQGLARGMAHTDNT